MKEELFEKIWLSDNNSVIFFSKQEVDSYLDSTLDDEDASPTEYSAVGGFRKVKLAKRLTKSEIAQLPEDKLLKLVTYDPTQKWRYDDTQQ